MESIVQIICSAYEEARIHNEACECILYSSGKELLESFAGDEIDIFFLDIECGESSGFDIAKELLKRKKDLGIVYITSYSHYVLQAFVCRPLGFIRKRNIQNDIKMPMANIIEFLEMRRQRITFCSPKGTIDLCAGDILAVEVFNHNVHIVQDDRITQFRGSLSKYEQTLIEYGFIKIARGVLVNPKFVSNIRKGQVCLSNGKRYAISRRQLQEVQKKLGGITNF